MAQDLQIPVGNQPTREAGFKCMRAETPLFTQKEFNMANQGGALKDTNSSNNNLKKSQSMETEVPESKSGMSTLLEGATEENKTPGETGSKSNVADMKSNVSNRAMEFAGRAKSLASDYAGNVGNMIDGHPRSSFFTGLGVGCLLGITVAALFRR